MSGCFSPSRSFQPDRPRPSVDRHSLCIKLIWVRRRRTVGRRPDQPRGTWFERIRQILQTQSFERADHHAKLGIWDVLCSPGLLESTESGTREDSISMGMFPDRSGPQCGRGRSLIASSTVCIVRLSIRICDLRRISIRPAKGENRDGGGGGG